MTTLVEKIYLAAANVGFLKTCDWQPTDSGAAQTHSVGFSAPDKEMLAGLGVSTEYEMTYPNSCFVGLKSRESVQIEGVAYQVREVTAVGDGSEVRAKLMRV
ncbi:MAG: hypothetical protein KJ614_09750 [Gammaproteobacteria bacterium]|uniref:hypothetical protein n=1 Tax=Rhodoferax sp. TaxID=50421 RepID=UPI0017E47D19|nr:hypothetical protein [Rhodoferax sp.]MBU3899195.1 hypothetical protein [Gammaproteobacteria bacterium]MBA3059136.1 hypothetical protein [Rhodoferax sp.]MBU4019431.1 hypothetical protein [Gammaproteobacteria bacterium]MBU4081995.1 hypothetical protein [Gammaproteobacteria bacterium]MBU4114010.1 hypothetical protein [Gammaproteobacteria bacterium]